jgi:hypothetical protein
MTPLICRCRAWALLAVGAALLFPAREVAAADGQDAAASPDALTYDLHYKLRAGDILRYEVEHRASIRSTIDESTQSAQTETSSVKVWKVLDVLPDGEMEFSSVVEQVHMVNQLPDRVPTEYDSRRDKTPPPGFEAAAQAVGVPLSVVRISPHGKIIHRDIKVRQEATDDDGSIVVRLPDEPVAVGATWDEPYEVKVQLQSGGTKVLQTRRHFELTDVAHGIATIAVTYQVLSPINSQIESQIVQRLMKGTVRFDVEAGRVVGQQMEIDKSILGFAGPTSSMNYVMRMQEKLIEPTAEVARKPQHEPLKSGPHAPARSPHQR